MTTWLPATAQGLTAAELSEKTLNWQKLKVITSSQKGDNGVVEFEACYNDTENPHDMKIMHEISEFIRIKSRWYYIGGRVS